MPIDFSPIANAPLNAMRAAAYGDAMQANRLQNRIAELSYTEMQKKQTDAKAFNQLMGEVWQPAQQPAAPVQAANRLGPRAATPPAQQQMPAVQAAPGSEIMGQMAQVPGGTAQPAATPAATQPAQPANQFTAQRQALATAFNEGRVTREQAVTFDQQITAAEQAAAAPRTASKLAIYKDLIGKALEAGDNESFQTLINQAQADPDVKSLTPDIEGVAITGKQQLEVTKMFTADEIKAVSEKFGIDPNTPPGMYKITTKGGKPVGWEPKEPPAEKGPEVRSFDGIVDDLHKKNPTWDKGRLNFEAGKVWDARKVSNSQQRTAFTFDLKNMGGSGHGGASGGDDNSFNTYEPDMKTEAFKDRILGTYKYPSGMKAMPEKQAFDKQFYKWRADNKITAADVMAERADTKANTASLAFNTKQLDASSSFIKTIDNNIDQLERHITEMSKTLNLDRNRILNMGTRDFNKKLVGVANINIYDMLVSAISTENAKLQAGGAGSVAQVSEGARVDMDKIHDKNLPVSEMIKLMDATREEGGNRIKALTDVGADIERRMRERGGKRPAASGKSPETMTRAISFGKSQMEAYTKAKLPRAEIERRIISKLQTANYSPAEQLQIINAIEGK